MKSKTYILIPLLALSAALPAQAQTAVPSKSAAVSIPKANIKAAATTTSTTTAKSRKIQDPIAALMETLASSIDKVNLQIENLQDQGADTIEAEGYIFDAKLHLHTVELYLNPGVEATTTATSTAVMKKSKDDLRKKAVEDLKGVYFDILSSIKALKKTIARERELLDITSDDSPIDLSAAATSTATSTAQ